MYASLFAVLGITNGNIDNELSVIWSGMEKLYGDNRYKLDFQMKDRLITISLTEQSFRFYITVIDNTPTTLNEWKEMATNFELPFSAAPVPEKEWPRISLKIHAGFPVIHYLVQLIFEEIKKAGIVEIITIPSV